VTNLPPCLKGNEGFSSIGNDLKQTEGRIEAPLVNCAMRWSIIPPLHFDSYLDWVERYYTDVPLLQAWIKTLTTQNDLLKQKNLDLKAHVEREKKQIKRSRNIVVKNTVSVKDIINSELIYPSLDDF